MASLQESRNRSLAEACSADYVNPARRELTLRREGLLGHGALVAQRLDALYQGGRRAGVVYEKVKSA